MPPKDNDDMLFNWLKEETVHIRNSLGEIHKKLDIHPKECPALQAWLKKPTIPPKSNIPWWNLLVKIGPFILAAAMGLVGIGAYYGSQSNTEQLEKDLKAVQKMLKESN